jgi:hypothetical protein
VSLVDELDASRDVVADASAKRRHSAPRHGRSHSARIAGQYTVTMPGEASATPAGDDCAEPSLLEPLDGFASVSSLGFTRLSAMSQHSAHGAEFSSAHVQPS